MERDVEAIPAGVVLAAGAGTRFGGPKALARTADGTPWLHLGVRLLRGAGCDPVLVVLGAAAADARLLVLDAEVVVATRWADGMGASLAAGIRALPPADVALVTLVDLPGTPVGVADRLLAGGAGPARLARAVYAGAPGHPVLFGRDHWPGLLESLSGDRGGRDYLVRHAAERVECGDLFDGRDVDRVP